MMQGLFNNTAIPVLEQCVNFAQNRHAILASNVANIDVPGYRARDLSVDEFQSQLREAVEQRDARVDSFTLDPNEPASASTSDPVAAMSQKQKSIVYHDMSNVSLEQQVAEITKNQMQHNLAITIMSNQFRLLQVAVSERV